MRLTFLARRDRIYDGFASSAGHLVVGAQLLSEMLGADGPGRAALAERLRNAEHDADEATHAILRQVNATFVTPFDREDIYRLASGLDDVMDEMEAAADIIVLYQVGELPVEIAEQVAVLVRATEWTARAMPRLRSMNDLAEYWIEINRLENQADKIHRRLLARLFSGEYDAMTVMRLKDVAQYLEDAADALETVANTVESIAVKRRRRSVRS